MNPEALLTEQCSITSRTPAGRDGYGNVLVTTTTRDLVRCWHEQTARSENFAGQDVADDTWNLYLPADDPLSATDQVTILGIAYEVVGDPWQTVNPRTRERGLVQATLRRTTG